MTTRRANYSAVVILRESVAAGMSMSGTSTLFWDNAGYSLR